MTTGAEIVFKALAGRSWHTVDTGDWVGRIAELVGPGIDAALTVERERARELEAAVTRLREALVPFARFARMWRAKPTRMDDTFYAIHTGTEWEAELKLSDCDTADRLLASPGAPATETLDASQGDGKAKT